MEEDKNKKANDEEYKLVEVPTAYGLAFQSPDGKHLTQEQLLVIIANDIQKIRKGVA